MGLGRFLSRVPVGLRIGRTAYFRINLSRQYRSYVAPARLALVIGCGVLLCAIAWDVSRSLVGIQESGSIRSELERLQQQDQQLIADMRQEGIDVSEAMVQQLPAEVALANHLLEKRIFSWTAFLTGLEQVIPPHIAISSVRLEAGSSIVHLKGTAPRLEDVTALTVGLQGQALFKDPVLAHHRVDPNGLVEFDVTLKYQRGGA
jgi:Tfp pilus assembly protein PilN